MKKALNQYLTFLLITVLVSLAGEVSGQNFFEKLFNKEDKDQKEKKQDNKQEYLTQKEEINRKQKAEYLFTEGVKNYLLENYEKSLENFRKSLELDSSEPAVYYQIARVHKEQGNINKAIKAGKKSLRNQSSNQHYYIFLADLYKKKQDLKKAAEVYEKLIDAVPDAKEHYFNLASLYMKQKEYRKAAAVYEKLEEKTGIQPRITQKKQEIYLKTNQLQKAVEEGQKLINKYPDQVAFKIQQAKLFLNNQKTEEAEKLLNQAIKETPENAEARLLLAKIFRQRGEEKEYLRQLKIAFKNPEMEIDQKVQHLLGYLHRINESEVSGRLVELAKIVTEVHPREAKAFSLYGDVLKFTDQYKKARESYLKALELEASHFNMWQEVVRLDSRLNDNDALINHSKEALELFPNQGILWYFNGSGHYMNKNYEKAVEALNHSRNLVTGNQQLQQQINALLGDSYHELEKYKESEEAYERVLKRDRNNPHVLNNYSYFLSVRGVKLEKAEKMASRLISRHPNDPTYLDTYGWVLYKQGNYKEAKKYLEKAAGKKESGTILEHYGDVLYQLGQKDKAIELWKEAKEKGDTSDLIDKKIADKKLYEKNK